ncbi:MAG: hypothetical protein Q9219_002413 [cf. Caloplaca sp. 3 TL-2023]
MPLDKIKSVEHRLNSPYAAFATPDSSLHKVRRAALNPFFSTRRVQGHENLIKSKVDDVCHTLIDQYAGKRRVLTVNDLFGCLMADVVMEIAFGHSYNLIASQDFVHPFNTVTAKIVGMSHYFTHLPWLNTLANSLPESVLISWSGSFRPILVFRKEIAAEIRQILARNPGKEKTPMREDTLFAHLLNSGLPPHELTEARLHHEALAVVGAGIETTRWSITVAFYHILSNPSIHQRLSRELKTAIPDPTSIPSWAELSRLPYLSACVEEALRLSYGVVQRSPRVSPHQPLQYKSYLIPPGTAVSNDTYHMHHNETVFPDSHTYDPSRWLNNPKGPDSTKQLSRYMVTFGRGTRMCLGMQLAYAEIFISLATLMRRFEWELADGVESGDVEFVRDFVTPAPRDGSRGVRVFVK